MDALGWLPLNSELEIISKNDVGSPCSHIRRAFPTSGNCTSYTGAWQVFGFMGMSGTQGSERKCYSPRDKGCRHEYGHDFLYQGHVDHVFCLSHDACVLLMYSFEMIEYHTQMKPSEACLLCQSPCERLVPLSLQPYCTDDYSTDLMAGFSGTAFVANRNRTTFNGHLAGFAMCAIQQDMQRRLADWQLPLWKVAAQGLMLLPSVFLFLWLLLCFTLSWISGDAIVAQWRVLPNVEVQQAAVVRARLLCRQMRRGQLETKPADKLFFYMDFGLFLMDYVTDWVSMILNFVNQDFVPAIVQGVIILIPYWLDCYKGKIQLVEAIGGFVRSRRKGYPTNAYIKALRSEKSVEAPLSLCLQYYSVLRLTSAFSFWVALISMSLSIWSLAKFCFVTFELGVTDEAAEDISADAAEGMPEPHQPVPPMPVPMPQRPPGVAPPNKGPTAPSMPKPHPDAFPDRPPGVAPPNQSPGSFPERPPGVAPPNQGQIQAAGLNLEMLCVGDESFHVHNFQLLRETQQNTRIRGFLGAQAQAVVPTSCSVVAPPGIQMPKANQKVQAPPPPSHGQLPPITLGHEKVADRE